MINKIYSDYKSAAHVVTVSNFRYSTLDLDTVNTSKRIDLNHKELGELTYFINTSDINRVIPYCPFIFKGDGTPFYEANLIIISMVEDISSLAPETIRTFAKDIVDYLRFCEDRNLDMYRFPRRKLDRPTYQYMIEVQGQVAEGRSRSTAQRMLNSVVTYYRELKLLGILSKDDLDNNPFEEMNTTLRYATEYGSTIHQIVKATDQKIKGSKSSKDSTYIYDGGKLLPMTYEHQIMMLEDIKKLASPELRLMILIALYTGGRKQTICTMKQSQFEMDITNLEPIDEVTIQQGAGAESDAKNDKKLYLKFPVWLIDQIQIYTSSKRAIKRRDNSVLKNSKNHYIFLTKHGAPYYYCKSLKEDILKLPPIKSPRNGDATRQQWVKMRDRLKIIEPAWNYKFHDLRATFGMNFVDRFMFANSKIEDVNLKVPDNVILNEVMARMGHKDLTTTQGYLNFRSFNRLIKVAQSDWENTLLKVACNA